MAQGDLNPITYGGPGAAPVYGKRKPPGTQAPTRYSPWGPAGGSWSTPGTTGGAGAFTGGGAGARKPGILSTPGHGEQVWDQVKGRALGPNNVDQYFAGLQGRTGGAGLQPTNTSEAYNAAKGYFQNPTMVEDWAGKATGQLGEKGYSEQLYESGNQGLNTHYDREWQKRQKRLEDTMSAAGVFGSGATARGMFELEAELGSQQARDMSDLANRADTQKMARFGEGRITAGAGTDAQRNRYGDYFDAGRGLDQEGRASEIFNRDTAGYVDENRRAQDESAFGMGERAQRLFEDRETGGLKAKERLATQYSGIIQGMTGRSADEQREMGENIIQSIVAGGTMDYQAATQEVENMFRAAGIMVTGLGSRGGGGGSTGADPDATMTPTSY